MKVSLQINLLLLTLLCGVVYAGYSSINQLNLFRNDALSINNLGIVRGSIQRITKQELNQINSDILIESMDKLLSQEKLRYQNNSLDLSNFEQKNILENISRLETAWHDLKSLYYTHRKTKNNTQEILDASEICWHDANAVVYNAQQISETKHADYKRRILFTLTSASIFIFCIIYLVYKIVHKNLEVKVITDPLTKLFNKNYFNEILQKQMKLKARYDTPFSLILCDIDYFKNVNDEFGHQYGDMVLTEFSELLQANARENDYVFRIGGEEFAIIVPQTSQTQATIIADKFRRLVHDADFGIDRSLTISLGVSEYLKDESAEALFRRTDSALYQAKTTGRNKVISDTYQHAMNF